MRREALQCRVDVLTKDFGIMHPEQTGLPHVVQAARVIVTANAESRSHVVVHLASAPWSTPLNLDQVEKLFSGDIVSCIGPDSPGCAEVSCTAVSELELLGAAAAVATLARSWSWDESSAIAVRFVGSLLSVSADPQFENDTWKVTVT